MTYNYEEARRVSVTKVYGEMTIGILVTAVVAVLGQITGAYYSFLMATGMVGLIGLCVAQIALAVVLGMRVTKMKSATARVMFYVYAALMGFILVARVFMVYDLGSIGVALGATAAFFFALTMFGMTTKVQHAQGRPDPDDRPDCAHHLADRARLRAGRRHDQDRLRHRPDPVRRHDHLRRAVHARAADRIRGPGPGNGQEDLHLCA